LHGNCDIAYVLVPITTIIRRMKMSSMTLVTRSWIGAIAGTVLIASTAAASEMATPEEAKAMSEKAMDAIDELGTEEAFAAFADPEGGFQEKDLYVFCMDMDGVMISHAKKPGLVGKNLLDFDKYGDKLFVNMIGVAKTGNEGWVNYNWPYPGTEEIREKTSYIIPYEGEFFCGVGAYK